MNGWRAGDDEIAHPHSPCRLQATGEYVERCPGRHHIIDDQHMRTIQTLAHNKRPAQIAQALGATQARLRSLLVTHTLHRIERQWQVPCIGQRPGKLDALIETAFMQTLWMQWHRQQHGRGKRPQCCQTGRKERRHRQMPAILERLDQAIEREAVTEGRPSGVKRRRRGTTLCAYTLLQGRNATLRAATCRRLWQTRGATGTQRLGAGGFATQDTTTRQQGIEQATPHI